MRRKGKVDPFGVKALLDLEIDPGRMIQIVPKNWRVVPVDDQNVQRVRVEFVERDARWKVFLVDGHVGMIIFLDAFNISSERRQRLGVGSGFRLFFGTSFIYRLSGGVRDFFIMRFGYGQNLPQDFYCAINLIRRRVVSDGNVEKTPNVGPAADIFYSFLLKQYNLSRDALGTQWLRYGHPQI